MALDKGSYLLFKKLILRAFNSDEIKYFSEWIYLYPTHSLEIDNIMIEEAYSIPTGWDGYGLTDLEKMVEEGILLKRSETEEDPVTLEKTVIFKLINK